MYKDLQWCGAEAYRHRHKKQQRECVLQVRTNEGSFPEESVEGNRELCRWGLGRVFSAEGHNPVKGCGTWGFECIKGVKG